MDTFEILTIALLAIILLIGIILMVKLSKKSQEEDTSALLESKIQSGFSDIKQDLIQTTGTMNQTNATMVETIGRVLQETQRAGADAQQKQMEQTRQSMTTQLDLFRQTTDDKMAQVLHSMENLRTANEQKLETIRSTMANSMKDIQDSNAKKLDEIKGTVDEKLQTTLEKRISESFKTVSDQLEMVYKSMGEMQTIASDVGGLKKVLSGVKTRGILGEIQLGAILEEILAPEQYETNVATVPGSSERVEFAVKLPGSDGQTVYLPIDSKFPGDRYAQLLDAQEHGDKAAVDAAYKALEQVIKSEAKDIRDKYICVPQTTNFGIMFLPFEGLYAEVVNHGLMEVLQHEYHVNITGPSTMAAYLNSLQMGFRTLAIQKRSSEVWEVLGAVKTEFEKFDTLLGKMQSHLSQTTKDLELLAGTRTRAIRRKLRDVEVLDMSDSARVLELSDSLVDGEGDAEKYD